MDSNMTSFETGSLAITVAGTAEQLTAHRIPQGFAMTITARATNTGYIYIGESKAKAEAHHVMLTAGAGVDTFIRFVHTCGDSGTGEIHWHAIWEPVGEGCLLAVA